MEELRQEIHFLEVAWKELKHAMDDGAYGMAGVRLPEKQKAFYSAVHDFIMKASPDAYKEWRLRWEDKHNPQWKTQPLAPQPLSNDFIKEWGERIDKRMEELETAPKFTPENIHLFCDGEYLFGIMPAGGTGTVLTFTATPTGFTTQRVHGRYNQPFGEAKCLTFSEEKLVTTCGKLHINGPVFWGRGQWNVLETNTDNFLKVELMQRGYSLGAKGMADKAAQTLTAPPPETDGSTFPLYTAWADIPERQRAALLKWWGFPAPDREAVINGKRQQVIYTTTYAAFLSELLEREKRLSFHLRSKIKFSPTYPHTYPHKEASETRTELAEVRHLLYGEPEKKDPKPRPSDRHIMPGGYYGHYNNGTWILHHPDGCICGEFDDTDAMEHYAEGHMNATAQVTSALTEEEYQPLRKKETDDKVMAHLMLGLRHSEKINELEARVAKLEQGNHTCIIPVGYRIWPGENGWRIQFPGEDFIHQNTGLERAIRMCWTNYQDGNVAALGGSGETGPISCGHAQGDQTVTVKEDVPTTPTKAPELPPGYSLVPGEEDGWFVYHNGQYVAGKFGGSVYAIDAAWAHYNEHKPQ